MAIDETGVIAGFYEAAFNPALFPDQLRQLGAFAEGIGAVLLLWDRQAGQPAWLATSGHTGADAPDAYTRHYGPLDPYRHVIEGLPTGTWTTCTQFFDEAFVANSAFYNEYLLPRGTRYMAGARVLESTDFNAYLGIHRGPSQAPLSADELQRLDRLGRHLSRALKTYIDVAHGRLEHDAALTVLGHSTTPSLLVDGTGRLLFSNPAAETLLRADDGIAVRLGRLTAERGTDERRLQRLLAIATRAATGERAGGEMLVTRPPGRPPITLMVAPVGPMTTLHSLAPAPVALVLLYDPTRQANPPTKRLRGLFGLTQAEATLAQGLLDGKRLTEIAASRHVSIETVRTQLRALFRKTGVSRQADLMRLLLTAPEPPPAP